MAHENFVGPKIRKAWGMKPKQHAGNTNKRGTKGNASEAKLKLKQAKPPKEDGKKKK